MNEARREQLLELALAATVGLLLLHPGLSGDALRAAGALAAGALLALHGRLSQRSGLAGLGTKAALGAGLVVALWAGLQLAPLPRGAVSALAPGTAALYAADEAASGAEPLARPLSLAPVTTARCALLALACLALLPVARARRGERLALCFALVGGLLALASLASLALQQDRSQWALRARWPLVNPNHLAATLTLCLGLGLGVALSRAAPRLRGLAALATALCVVGLVATRSRAGVACAALTALAALALAGLGSRRRLGAGLLAVAALAGGVALSDPEPLRERLGAERAAAEGKGAAGISLQGRAESWALALGIARGAPLAGAGLGTFDEVSPAFLDPTIQRWTRPGAAHCDYLELAAGVGWPVTCVALVALALALAAAARGALAAEGTPRAVAAGALAGLGGVLAHSAVDFPLHNPGPAALAVVALAVALGPLARDEEPRPARRRATVALGALLALAGALWLWVAAREQQAEEAFARIAGVRAALRPTQAERMLPTLRAAALPLARARTHALLAQALVVGAAPGSPACAEALATTREAARRAPASGQLQVQLAWMQLLAEPGALPPERAREVLLRLELGVARAPTYPQVLRRAALTALELLVRTGDPRALERAGEWLQRYLLQRPGERRALRAELASYAPRLGRAADLLRERLAE
ncbi:MAG: O-antigen ligase family protein [Planctomycetota bacterium]